MSTGHSRIHTVAELRSFIARKFAAPLLPRRGIRD